MADNNGKKMTMQEHAKKEFEFERRLAAERPRLVGLCRKLSGRPEAAEDLAQETMVAAWKSQGQLVSLEKIRPWTSAIARNVCLNWARGYYRDQAHTYLIENDEQTIEDVASDAFDLEFELDRTELATLLDRALALLPENTAEMLIAHYLEESSHAEIAERMQLNKGTVAVRLQRGKVALRKLLQNNLKEEAQAFDLIQATEQEWAETNIWCLGCGKTRLLGKFKQNECFAVRCPQCEPDPQGITTGLDLTQSCHADILGNVKSYKPAYKRVITAFMPLYEEALQSRTAPCLACGHALEVNRTQADKSIDQIDGNILLFCRHCGWASNKSVSGWLMAIPKVQKFWRANPRLKIVPTQEIETQGTAAIVGGVESVTSAARLEVVMRRDTFEVIGIRTNIKL